MKSRGVRNREEVGPIVFSSCAGEELTELSTFFEGFPVLFPIYFLFKISVSKDNNFHIRG